MHAASKEPPPLQACGKVLRARLLPPHAPMLDVVVKRRLTGCIGSYTKSKVAGLLDSYVPSVSMLPARPTCGGCRSAGGPNGKRLRQEWTSCRSAVVQRQLDIGF